MKYPQLVSMPSAVSDWLEEQLETRGFDSEVYTHYILSLLRTHTLDIICPEDDLSLSCFKKDGGRSANSQKRSRRSGAWWKYAHADAEQIKRSVAVECLMSASEQKCEIESLVDELCQKLKEDNFEADSSPTKTNQDLEFEKELQKSQKNSPEEYYAAFPALNQKGKSSYLSSNINFVVSKWPSPKKSLDQINLIAAKWTNSGSPKKAKRKPKKPSSEPNMKSTLRSNNYRNKLGYKKTNCVRNLSKEMADNMTNWDFVFNNNNYIKDYYLDFFSVVPQNNEDVPKEQECLPMHLLEENEGDFNETNNKDVVDNGNLEVASAPVIYNSNIWDYGSFARNWPNMERANAKNNRSATEGLYINTCDCAYCMGDYRKLKELGPQQCRAGFPTFVEPSVDNAESDDGDSAIPGEYRRDHSTLSHIRWCSATGRRGIIRENTPPSAFVRYETSKNQDKFENAPPDHPYSRPFGPPMRRPEMPPGVAVMQQEDHYFSDQVRFRVISPVRQGNLNGVYGDGGTFQEEASLEQLHYTTSPVSGLLRLAGQCERYIEPHPETLLSTRIGGNHHFQSPTGPNSFKPKVRVVGNNKSCQTDDFKFLEEFTSFKTTEEPIRSQIKADYYLFMDDTVVDSWATDVVDFIIDIVPELSKMAHSENQNCQVKPELMDRMKGGALEAVVNSLYEYFNIEGNRARRFYEVPVISDKQEKELQDLKGDPYTPDEDSIRLPWMYEIPEIATQANINEAEADEEVRSIFYGSLQDTFNLAAVEDKKEVVKFKEDDCVLDNMINNEILTSTFEKCNITFCLEDLSNIWIMPIRSSVTL